jgi:hypothetical protein
LMLFLNSFAVVGRLSVVCAFAQTPVMAKMLSTIIYRALHMFPGLNVSCFISMFFVYVKTNFLSG